MAQRLSNGERSPIADILDPYYHLMWAGEAARAARDTGVRDPNQSIADRQAMEDRMTDTTGIIQRPDLYVDPDRRLEYFQYMAGLNDISEEQRRYYQQRVAQLLQQVQSQAQQVPNIVSRVLTGGGR